MKLNSRRQLAQVALFSLLALGAGSAFAQTERPAPGLTSPSGPAGIKALAATNKPVGGVGIRVCKNPGGCSNRTAHVPVQSGVDGSFQFMGLEPGNYDVTPDGGKTELHKVGADGKLSGFVQEEGGVRSVVKLRPGGMGPAGPAGTFSPTSAANGNGQGNANPTPNSSPKAATPPSSAPGGAERGIKDNGTKSFSGVGIKG